MTDHGRKPTPAQWTDNGGGDLTVTNRVPGSVYTVPLHILYYNNGYNIHIIVVYQYIVLGIGII